ncbi:ATP-binding protein [Streptomyces sp. BE147]|uniref:ATP-binding protein n=1 Tax=Streptomyces sp. BE147 TaxID=3002524 RepID=UPI002E77B0FF|nr:ATP-binding protein [Streptomyces sp. BE147]MEE1741193.1 ATP-binding protein [Streptomyces sp. BE147]
MVTEQPQAWPDGRTDWTRRSGGTLTAHVAAEAAALSALRADSRQVLRDAGVPEDIAHTVQLVLSELVGNAVRAFGDGVRLTVEVRTGADGITVGVTDPEPGSLPLIGPSVLDSPDAEHGRGLMIIGLLCEQVDVEVTPVGKCVRCLVALP